MPILYYLVLEPTIYRTRGEHANHFTIDVDLANCIIFKNYIYYSLNKEKNLLNKKKNDSLYSKCVEAHVHREISVCASKRTKFISQNPLSLHFAGIQMLRYGM